MKKLINTLFILFIFLSATAQVNEQEITGKWKAKAVSINNAMLDGEEDKNAIEAIKEAFLNATFNFKADHNFDMDISVKDIALANHHWKINPASGDIYVQEWKDKDKNEILVMIIQVRKKDGKIFFLLQETPIIVEVVRM